MIKGHYTLLFVLCIFFSFSGLQAQNEVVDAIKADNVERLANILPIEYVDECIVVNGNHMNYLAAAIHLGASNVTEYLISSGADLNTRCENKTALMYAVEKGSLKTVKKLISAGANPNIKNGTKELIYYARKYKHNDITKYLKSLEQG